MLGRLLLAALLTAPILSAAQTAPAATTEPAASETPAAAAAAPKPKVSLHTSMGDLVIELEAEKAPKSVENFLQYVRDGHYNGTIFHRVIDGFMIQGGGYTADLQLKPTRASIENEARNGLGNVRGSVAMARTSDPNSAQAQFFVNLVDNPRLNYVSDQSGWTWGYAVFGQIVEGMDVIDKMRSVETGGIGPLAKDVPLQNIVIERAEILIDAAPAAEPAAAPTGG